MRKMSFIGLLVAVNMLIACGNSTAKAGGDSDDKKVEVSKSEKDLVIQMTAQMFKEKVMDYEKNKDKWVYEGKIPCVIDFYATWCGPCKRVAPIMTELAAEYKGRVIIYKVDVDKEPELSRVFAVSSIPSILFCPVDGNPAMQPGAMSKEDYQKAIDEFLLKIPQKAETK